MQQLPAIEGVPPPMEAAPANARRARRTWYVVLALCFFAAVIPETLTTTSTSVAKIITAPTSLPFIMLFYGLADLLIREAVIRRRLGWVSLVLLGVAFSFINEGVIAGTWYPGKYDGETYIGGISFVVVAGLTVFHIFISVFTPIAFIEAIFPAHAGLRLLRRRGIIISSAVFLLVVSLVGFVPSYRAYRLAVLALALVLALVALRLPAARPRVWTATPPPSLWRLRWAGFCGMALLFVMILLVPWIIQAIARKQVLAAQAVSIIILVLFTALLLRIGRRWTAHAGWSLRHTLALITGALVAPGLFMLLPWVWPTLEFVAVLPLFALLVVLDLRLRRRARLLVDGDATHDERDAQDFDRGWNLAENDRANQRGGGREQ
jgi:hypothetical protein